MKLIFLHGLGQDASSWQEVQQLLPDYTTEALELFPSPATTYQSCKEDILTHLQAQTEDFVLIGLSLGGVLALYLSDQDLPHLKGLVLSGSQYKLSQNLLYKLQIGIFTLLPRAVFAKQGADKTQMVQILKELADLDLSTQARACQVPTLILCGSKDKPNLKASQELHELLSMSKLILIPDGGHTLNNQKPTAFAQEVQTFLERNFSKL